MDRINHELGIMNNKEIVTYYDELLSFTRKYELSYKILTFIAINNQLSITRNLLPDGVSYYEKLSPTKIRKKS